MVDGDVMGSDRPLVRADAALWRTTLRGVLVLVPGRDEPVLCTSPGDVIWELLGQPMRPSELVDLLATEYQEDAAVIRADLQPVLAQLLDIGALVQGEGDR